MNVKSLSLEEVELFSFTFSINYNISTISKYTLMYDTMQADRVPTPVSLYRQTSKLQKSTSKPLDYFPRSLSQVPPKLILLPPDYFPRSLLS